MDLEDIAATKAMLEEYDDAISYYMKALEVETELGNSTAISRINAEVRSIHSALGRYEEAIRCYDKAIEIDPNNAYPWYKRQGLSLKRVILQML